MWRRREPDTPKPPDGPPGRACGSSVPPVRAVPVGAGGRRRGSRGRLVAQCSPMGASRLPPRRRGSQNRQPAAAVNGTAPASTRTTPRTGEHQHHDGGDEGLRRCDGPPRGEASNARERGVGQGDEPSGRGRGRLCGDPLVRWPTQTRPPGPGRSLRRATCERTDGVRGAVGVRTESGGGWRTDGWRTDHARRGACLVVFLQNGSDAVVWWSSDPLLHKPQRVDKPLGQDITSAIRWFPLVPFWQTAADMTVSYGVAAPHGHRYGPIPWTAGPRPSRPGAGRRRTPSACAATPRGGSRRYRGS
ncbi:alpha/beta-hydrolase family protein [Streptomyces sp. R41]|uniref:Alpha/beta-hydrolase family protein n=1 Tax=Streptomyces sp. R41 TaxID=3238632 RepID=A0AB39RFS2_9ACTN